MPNNLFGEHDTPIELYEYSKRPSFKDIDKIIYKYPTRPEVYVLLAHLFKLKQNNVSAIKYYKKAIYLNPNNASYYAIIARYLLQEGCFYESIYYFTYLIEHKKLYNHEYYSSRKTGLRLIAACCIGEWSIAKEDILHIEDNYIFYTKPIIGKIDKERLVNSIKRKEKLETKLEIKQ